MLSFVLAPMKTLGDRNDMNKHEQQRGRGGCGHAIRFNVILIGLVGGMIGASQGDAAGCPTPSFGPATSYATGFGPYGVAVSDLNGDGYADLVVANPYVNYSDSCDYDSTISVLLGRGDGTFQTRVDYAVGRQPRMVATGDFDNDGNQDVVVTSNPCGVLSLFLGRGDGTLRSRADLTTGGDPWAVAVGDFNADGHLDVACAERYAGHVSVLRGNGDGTFQSPVSYSPGCGPLSILVADFDEDGVLDLVVGCYPGTVTLMKGGGDGSFLSPVFVADVGVNAANFGLGDLDHDGHLDLVVATENGHTVVVLRGDGNGTFTASEIPQPCTTEDAKLADVTGDGHLDLIVSRHGEDTIAVLAGNGDGTFAQALTFPVPLVAPFDLAVADFDRDGAPDIACTVLTGDPWNYGFVSVLLNQCVPPYVVAAGTARGCPGTQVVVPVATQGTRTLGTVQFSMHWDPAVATFVGVEQIGLAGMSYAENFGGDMAAGTLTVSWEDPSLAGTTVPDGTTLFAVRFTVNGPLGATSAVTIDGNPVAIEFTEPDLDVLTVVPQAGQVGILSTVSIAGRVLYYAASRAVPGVDLTLTGDATQTVPSGTDGAYVHTVNACGDYLVTPSKASDSPLAAGVTMLDASLVRRHVLRIQSVETPYKLLAADVNGSESISTVDIRLIKQLVLGLRSSFPAGLWRFVRSDYTFPNPSAPWDPESTRSYTDLSVDLTGEDYTSIKLGDVNGSWTVGGGGALMSFKGSRTGVRLQHATKPASLRVGSQTAPPKGVVKVPVTASNLTRMTSSQFTLRWDPKVLRYTGVSGFGLSGGGLDDFGTAGIGHGLLTFAWDDPAGRGVNVKEANLFWVTFAVIGRAGSSTPVTITSSPTLQEIALDFVPAAVATEAGAVKVVPEKAAPQSPAALEYVQ